MVASWLLLKFLLVVPVLLLTLSGLLHLLLLHRLVHSWKLGSDHCWAGRDHWLWLGWEQVSGWAACSGPHYFIRLHYWLIHVLMRLVRLTRLTFNWRCDDWSWWLIINWRRHLGCWLLMLYRGRIHRKRRSRGSGLVLLRCHWLWLWSFPNVLLLVYWLNACRGFCCFIVAKVCDNSRTAGHSRLGVLSRLGLLHYLLLLSTEFVVTLLLLVARLLLVVLALTLNILPRCLLLDFLLLRSNSFNLERFFWFFNLGSIAWNKLLMSPVHSISDQCELQI